MRRPLLDISSQFLPFAAQLVERVLFTAVLVQRLGVDQFERWSLIFATLSLLTMLDLGTQMTFSNRMAKAANSGDLQLAGRIYRESNSIFAGLAVLLMVGSALFAFVPAVQSFLGFDDPLSPTDSLVALLLGTSLAIRMALSNALGAYRANLAFARGTLVMAVTETVRWGVAAAALLAAPGLLAPAAATAAFTALTHLFIIPRDIGGRFGEFRFRLALPSRVTTHRALPDSLLFSVNYLPQVVLTQIPVLIIGSRAATGILASFLLMRTIANMIRAIVQRFASVIGMELGRLEVQGRIARLVRLYTRSGHFAAYCFGIGCGFILVWGDVALNLWTGSPELYDPLLLAVMLMPLALAPGLQIAAPFVTYSHRPGPLAVAVMLQTALAALLALALPVPDLVLRFTLAIYGAELFCLAPILFQTVRQAVNLPIWRLAFLDSARALLAGIATYLVAAWLRDQWTGVTGMMLSGLLFGLLLALILSYSARSLLEELRADEA